MTTVLPRHRWLWLLAGAIMVLELFIFHQLAAQRQAMVYPRWSDQIQYLSESYYSYDELKAHGWGRGLVYACTNPAAQGTLHDIVAVVAFGLFGPSRALALDLNMLVFVAWQAMTLFAIRRLTGSAALGWLGFGLLLCLAGPWTGDAGSAVDFRLDHAAMCLWGIAGTSMLLTRGFRDLRWSLVFGLLTGLTIVERFLTGAYFAPVFLAAAIWILCGEEKSGRLRNLILAGAIAFVIAAPFFWVNRTWIYNYYYQGHFANAESAARAPGLGLWDSITYIIDGFSSRHMGWVFGLFALGLTLIPLLLESFWDRLRTTKLVIDRDWLFTSLLFFVVPTAILCLHRQKSEYVLGIIAPGLVLCLLWIWHLMLPGVAGLTRHGRFVQLAATAAVALGLSFFIFRQTERPYRSSFLADSRKMDAFVDRLYQASRQPGSTEPNIGIDQIMDSLDGTVMRVVAYEHHRVWIVIHTQLPISILTADEEEIFARMAKCDFFFLTDEQNGNGYWPYDHQMRTLYPRLKEWCEAHMDRIETITMFQKKMSLYQRRPIP
jgi:hypothetical protein